MKKNSSYTKFIIIYILTTVILNYVDHWSGMNFSKDEVLIFLISLFIIVLTHNLYEKVLSNSNELSISTNNDDSSKIFGFIMGTISILLGINYTSLENIHEIILCILCFTIAILLFISVFVFPHTGLIRIKKQKLYFIKGSKTNYIPIDQINSIEFQNANIIVTDINQEQHRVNFLNLIEEDYSLITNFLQNHPLTNNLQIVVL